MRSLLILVFTLLLMVPGTASAAVVQDDGPAAPTMSALFDDGQSGLPQAAEPVEMGSFENRERRFRVLDSLQDLAELLLSPASDGDVENSRNVPLADVVQSFRTQGVRLLSFGTAPPLAMNAD